jgi:hypothetical protein
MAQKEEDWYKRQGCSHAHCPKGCEKPQPFFDGQKMLCGRCFFKYKEFVEMVPCTPQTCPEDVR